MMPAEIFWIRFGLYALQSTAFIFLSFAVWWLACRSTFKKWHWPKADTAHLMICWALCGLVGGRLTAVLQHLEVFLSSPEEILNFYRYGISVFGVFAGSSLYLALAPDKYPFSKMRVLDVLAVNLPLGLSIFSLLYIMFNPGERLSQIEILFKGLYGMGSLIIWAIVRFRHIPQKYSHFGDGFYVTVLLMGLLQTACLLFYRFGFNGTDNNTAELLNGLILTGAGLFGFSPWRKKEQRLARQKPVVLFDLDGTLQDSQPLIFETFAQVFKQLKPDYELSEDELYSFFGPTLETTFSRYFPADQVEDVIELYQKINLELHDEMLTPMPHAAEVLKALKEEGYTIGIVSNKRTPVVRRGMQICGFEKYADLVLGKEDLPKPKPEPDGLIKACLDLGGRLDCLIYVGDNPSDILAARNMAACSIGYTNDERQRQALSQAAPCWNIMDLREILNITKEDQEWIDKSIW
mgnify:CR=1 FL=1